MSSQFTYHMLSLKLHLNLISVFKYLREYLLDTQIDSMLNHLVSYRCCTALDNYNHHCSHYAHTVIVLQLSQMKTC